MCTGGDECTGASDRADSEPDRAAYPSAAAGRHRAHRGTAIDLAADRLRHVHGESLVRRCARAGNGWRRDRALRRSRVHEGHREISGDGDGYSPAREKKSKAHPHFGLRVAVTDSDNDGYADLYAWSWCYVNDQEKGFCKKHVAYRYSGGPTSNDRAAPESELHGVRFAQRPHNVHFALSATVCRALSRRRRRMLGRWRRFNGR